MGSTKCISVIDIGSRSNGHYETCRAVYHIYCPVGAFDTPTHHTIKLYNL